MIDKIDIETIKRNHSGQWFSPNNIRFFGSRLAKIAYRGAGGIFFVSSERCRYLAHTDAWKHPRAYSVRQQLPDGSIDTMGEFQAYRSRETAHRVAKTLAKGE